MAPFELTMQALASAGVRFVVVGGVAVVLQGHPRLTVDLDVVLDFAEDNALLAINVLTGLGLQPRLPVPAAQFADPAVRASWISDHNVVVFSMHDPDDPRREIDLFTDPLIPFPQLWARADVVDLGGLQVRVAAVEDLLAMKRAAGRPQDLADIAALESLRRAAGDQDG